jgi:surface antigen
MKGIETRLLAAGAALLALAGCASPSYYDGSLPHEPGRNLVERDHLKQMQCAPYAREHSQVKIFGDANTWWDKAAGHFTRGAMPEQGSVMVLADYAGPDHGHLAVVKELVSAREIRVDHANWLNDGSIYVNDPVVDVSAANDWSAVKVWNIKAGSWGVRIYPVKGFIGPVAAAGDRVAQAAQDAAIMQSIQ